MDAVFLSASVPDPRRDPRFHATADVIAIREAVRALAAVVLPRSELVFGGHPAITPLVRQVAEAVGGVHAVHIYQSRYFEQHIPPDATALSGLTWVDAVGDDRDASLRVMRERMLSALPLHAAVFIGGMEGVLDEHALVANIAPAALRLPVGSTGSAAAVLLQQNQGSLPRATARVLWKERAYGAMFERLLLSLSA